MEPLSPTSKWQIVIKYSLIYALACVALSLVFYIMNIETQRNWMSTFANFIIVVSITYFGIKARRDESLNGFITYGQGVGTGVLISVFAGILVGLYSIIFMKYIDPEFFNRIIENSKKEMIEKGDPEERIETAVMWMKKMQNPLVMFTVGTIGYILYGLVVSLIVSIFTRKNNPDELYNSLDN